MNFIIFKYLRDNNISFHNTNVKKTKQKYYFTKFP